MVGKLDGNIERRQRLEETLPPAPSKYRAADGKGLDEPLSSSAPLSWPPSRKKCASLRKGRQNMPAGGVDIRGLGIVEKRDPFPQGSRRCSRGLNERKPRRTTGATPAARAALAAARAIARVVLAFDMQAEAATRSTDSPFSPHAACRRKCRILGPACVYHAAISDRRRSLGGVCRKNPFGFLFANSLTQARVTSHRITITKVPCVSSRCRCLLLHRLRVRLERHMPIEMVGRDVEQHGDLRSEQIHRSELERDTSAT